MKNPLTVYRENAGYDTQEKFAKAMGVKRHTVSRWESGHRRPDISLIPIIAQKLHCTESEVIAAITATSDKSKQAASIV